ncbi:MAG TPA: hypothetical protein VFQ61_23140, partial [Polyangiaceae bacterium]|nr:hypothetical protein [Polyangiaceae bacterium]
MPRAPLRELWYARHAKPVSSGVCYGHHDVPVIDLAPSAAVKLHELFPGSASPRRVWSSPSLRCWELACELAQLWGA